MSKFWGAYSGAGETWDGVNRPDVDEIDPQCLLHPRGCRLVSDGAVCKERCEWLVRQSAPKFPENEGT